MKIDTLFEFVVCCLALNVFNILIWFIIFYINSNMISYFEKEISEIKKMLREK